MSYNAIFGNLIARLKRHNFETMIRVPGQDPQSSGVQAFVDELIRGLQDTSPIPINLTIEIENQTDGPAFHIFNTGPNQQQHGVRVEDEAGRIAQLGIGLGNQNLVANEFIPYPPAFVSPDIAAAAYSPNGVAGGDPTSPAGQALGSGYGAAQFGTGIPGDIGGQSGSYSPIPWGQVLSSILPTGPASGGPGAAGADASFVLNMNGQIITWGPGSSGPGGGGGGEDACDECPTQEITYVTGGSFDAETCALTLNTSTVTVVVPGA